MRSSGVSRLDSGRKPLHLVLNFRVRIASCGRRAVASLIAVCTEAFQCNAISSRLDGAATASVTVNATFIGDRLTHATSEHSGTFLLVYRRFRKCNTMSSQINNTLPESTSWIVNGLETSKFDSFERRFSFGNTISLPIEQPSCLPGSEITIG